MQNADAADCMQTTDSVIEKELPVTWPLYFPSPRLLPAVATLLLTTTLPVSMDLVLPVPCRFHLVLT